MTSLCVFVNTWENVGKIELNRPKTQRYVFLGLFQGIEMACASSDIGDTIAECTGGIEVIRGDEAFVQFQV
jgi:hypothetical protein